jgi:hypothetical protein
MGKETNIQYPTDEEKAKTRQKRAEALALFTLNIGYSVLDIGY